MSEYVELLSEDGIGFKVSRRALWQSQMLSAMEIEEDSKISLATVTGPVLAKVVEYLTAHEKDEPALGRDPKTSQIPKRVRRKDTARDGEEDNDDESVKSSSSEEEEDSGDEELGMSMARDRYRGLTCGFDQKFIASMAVSTLLEVTKAANYLGIDTLLELGCRSIAGHMRGLSTEAIRAKFGIKCDFNPEEEERIRREGLWAEDF